MPQGDGVRVDQIVWDQGSEEEVASAGVATPATFPPKTLEPNQAHGAPNHTALHPVLPPRPGET